jgi:hypothetical protein
MAVLFILIVFAVCVGGCWALFRGFAELFIKDGKETYVDKTTHIHNHYYDNRSVHVDKETFKGLK